MSIDSYVVSKHLMLESEDGEDGVVIHNTRTGHRLSLTEESMKILAAFRSAKSTREAASELGVAEGEPYEEFLSILAVFAEAFFLIEIVEGKAEEPLAVDRDTLFVSARTPFVYCPSVDVGNLEEGSIVVAGVSLDQATTGNPGTRLGPDRLREVSTKFLAYERDIFTRRNRGWHNADLGTVILEASRLETWAMSRIEPVNHWRPCTNVVIEAPCCHTKVVRTQSSLGETTQFLLHSFVHVQKSTER